MPFEDWRQIKPGARQLSAADLNRLAEEVARQSRQEPHTGAFGGDGGGYLVPEDSFQARITSVTLTNGSPPAYSWLPVLGQDETLPAPVFQDIVTNGRGTAAFWPAIERAGRADVPVDGSAVVWLTPSEGGGRYYVFNFLDSPIWAQIQSPGYDVNGCACYEWQQMLPQLGCTFAVYTDGLFGTIQQNPLVEIHGILTVPTGSVVSASRGACSGYPYVWIEYVQVGDGESVSTVQSVELDNNPVGGTYTLTLYSADATETQATTSLAYNATAVQVQAALNVAAENFTDPGVACTSSSAAVEGPQLGRVGNLSIS